MSDLSPSPRTRVRRHPERAHDDRGQLFALLDEALVCHLGVVVDGAPAVIPTAYGVDPAGPDAGGTLYVHGSVAARSLQAALTGQVCVTVTVLDGLVLARSAFHHSMNYRCAIIYGTGRLVQEETEKRHALDLVVDHVVPHRSQTLRPHRRKELAATAVIAFALHEASVKQRAGAPVDDGADVESGGWAGVLPLRLSTDGVVTSPDAVGSRVPGDVRQRVTQLQDTMPAG
ncbi:MAG: pyridoxamine 5'-phosphate oxidase family protein [Propionibacteriales bacterium]|nr:pyridoxamine 5'-phosphate oxidase family protein [Propionibacteriales bacterium]